MRPSLRRCLLILALFAPPTLLVAEHPEAATAATVAALPAVSTMTATAEAVPEVVMVPATPALERVLARSSARLGAAKRTLELLAHPVVQQAPSSSLLQQFSMVTAMRRRVGERWNTSDSSRPNDFALCYRLSRVMGVQVVPGDLSPSKLPTPKMLSVHNQGSGMGVLVGMTFRLARR